MKAIIHGMTKQLQHEGMVHSGAVGLHAVDDSQQLEDMARSPERGYSGKFRDDISGQVLRDDLVMEARRRELDYFTTKGVWIKKPRQEAYALTGRPPISTRWVDVNKGDDEDPKYRSRLVARQLKATDKSGQSYFAPTPPLESLRSILSLAATDLEGDEVHSRDPHSELRTQVQILDISRAYFNAVTDDSHPTYVELPAEDPDSARGLCGHLLVHLYGTRRAADGWHSEYSNYLVESLGFVRGGASACVFKHRERRLVTSVYGDDFTTSGPKVSLDWLKAELEKKYELSENGRLGPGPTDDREAKILNRIIRWTPTGLEMEADPRQVEKLVRDLGLVGSNPLGTPGTKATTEQISQDKPLEFRKCKPFRAVAARANYLSADRPECQYSAKEVCRWMANPTETSVAALKRLGRFLEGRRRLVYTYPWQSAKVVDVYSDTDWGGCGRTRKSTSGGCLMVGSHLVKSWSSTQNLVSLSSGEAEYYGVVKAASIGLGYQALLADLDVALPLRVWTDSTATMGICGRQGLGKLRHIDTQCLWVQQRVRDKSFELRKVKGTENPADLFTKHLTSAATVESLLKLFGCEYRDGRAATAPQLRSSPGTEAGESLLKLDLLRASRTEEQEVTGQVEVEGYMFPTVAWEGEQVVEAYSYPMTLLPHQMDRDMARLFPQAVAAPALGDRDVIGECDLEQRGLRIGKSSSR